MKGTSIIIGGVGGQGVYISPATDTVVAWFCTSDGNNQEEAMARAIVKALNRASKGGNPK